MYHLETGIAQKPVSNHSGMFIAFAKNILMKTAIKSDAQEVICAKDMSITIHPAFR